MAKPAITKRAVKAAALTYAELDTNFQNLADATVTVTVREPPSPPAADASATVTVTPVPA